MVSPYVPPAVRATVPGSLPPQGMRPETRLVRAFKGTQCKRQCLCLSPAVDALTNRIRNPYGGERRWTFLTDLRRTISGTLLVSAQPDWVAAARGLVWNRSRLSIALPKKGTWFGLRFVITREMSRRRVGPLAA